MSNMSFIRGFRRCARLFKQRAITRMIHDRQIGAMRMEHRRHFRYDDRINWPSGNPGESKIFKEEGFDPRYDERHFKSYLRSSGSSSGSGSWKDPESRRRIQQDTSDHQRRQERIIQENKYRWQHRSDSKRGINYGTSSPLSGPSKRGDPSEEYSRQRKGREQRQKEVKRQARELRESRKNYNLPGYNRPLKSEAEAPADAEDAADQPSAEYNKHKSEAWLEKQAQENERKYWHTWHTCPAERVDKDLAADASEELIHGFNGPRGPHKGLVKPPQPYDGGVRRFQTHSVQSTDDELPSQFHRESGGVASSKRLAKRRKPSGMEKQYRLARDFTRVNRISDESNDTSEDFSRGFKRPSSLLPRSFTVTKDEPEQERLQEIELPQQPPRMKLAWQGLPRPVYKRFDGIQRAVDRRIKRRLQPPRYHMTVKSKGLTRQRTPIDSFSSTLDIDTRYTPCSEYLGFGRQSVCDAWQNFASRTALKTAHCCGHSRT